MLKLYIKPCVQTTHLVAKQPWFRHIVQRLKSFQEMFGCYEHRCFLHSEKKNSSKCQCNLFFIHWEIMTVKGLKAQMQSYESVNLFCSS